MGHVKFTAIITGDITTAISEAHQVARKANVEIHIVSDNEKLIIRPDSHIMDLLEIYDLKVKLHKLK